MVLMLTASGTPGDRVSGLELGADDYLSKPFHFPELVLGCERSPAQADGSAPGGAGRPGSTSTPSPDGHPGRAQQVELSVKEMAVLEALMRASPAFLSAEDLLEQVWDENADPFTKTVQVTIGRLRRKLGEPPIIETLAGAGYRMG